MGVFLLLAASAAVLVIIGLPTPIATTIAVSIYAVYYVLTFVKVPELVIKDGPLRKFTETHLPVVQEQSWPTPWLVISPWIHTITATVISLIFEPFPKYRREVLQLSDGGQIALDWYDTPDKDFKTIVIVIPGIIGDSRIPYLRDPLRMAHAMNCASVVMNYRSFGGITLKTKRIFCATDSDDIASLVEHVHKLHPKSTLVGLGFSMGGILLTRYIAEKASVASRRLTAAMTVGSPWDLGKTSHIVSQGLNKILTAPVAFEIKRIGWRERNILAQGDNPYNFADVLKAGSLRELDAKFTAPLFGYRDVDHYYKDASLEKFIDSVSVPLIALSAADDPLVPFDSIPLERIRRSRRVALVLTDTGGHLGHKEGLFGQHCFTTRLLEQFLNAVTKHGKDLKAI